MTDNRQRGGNAFNREQGENQMLARVDTDRLAGGMVAAAGSGNALRTNFLPSSFGEAMELAKLMASGSLVPDRFRGKPGDCLAVVMQATRWGMDPFAVAQKVYFVNNNGIPGYEAQLVAAVLNTSGVLEGRLKVSWTGDGEDLKCTARGKLKGESEDSEIEVELRTIKTRNSPLWVQQPKIQLGYYAQRAWGRLFAPEVMLGVYAADDLVEDGAVQRAAEARPVAPSRTAIAERNAAPERVIDNGETVDATTGEAVDPISEDEREQIERDLDAEQRRAEVGDDDTGPDLEDALQEEIDQAGEDESDPDPDPEPVVEKTATVGPNDGALPPQQEQPIDWEAWLAKFDKDLAACKNVDAINDLYASKTERLKTAPGGVVNRARGYHAAALRKLEAPATEQKPATRKRAIAAADRVAEQSATDPAPAGEAVADEPNAEVDPRTAKADAIIAELGKKEMLVDLRQTKANYDADIDSMDEQNAKRVIRAFRALEDKLTGKAR